MVPSSEGKPPMQPRVDQAQAMLATSRVSDSQMVPAGQPQDNACHIGLSLYFNRAQAQEILARSCEDKSCFVAMADADIDCRSGRSANSSFAKDHAKRERTRGPHSKALASTASFARRTTCGFSAMGSSSDAFAIRCKAVAR